MAAKIKYPPKYICISRKFFLTLHPKLKVDKFGCLQPLQKMLKLHFFQSSLTSFQQRSTGNGAKEIIVTPRIDF